VRDLAQQLAQELTKKHPDLVLWKMTKSLRPGKVFLDWSQNVAAKTTVAPYSLRGRETPTCAAPRTWDEVEAGSEDPEALQQLMFDEVLERVDRDGDLLEGLLSD
jgi:bifunctional non-homologous end joining protein LigD